jgi:putative ABC transport system permease protein
MRLWRRRQDQALADEIREHIEAETQLNIERGMTRDEARSAALRRFGNVTRSTEESRAVWRSIWMEQLLQDLRYALRMFRRNPVFSITTILVIAVGIGASTSVFSVVDRVLFRSLSYPDAERLISVGINAPILDFDFLFASDYLYLRQAASPFESLTSWTGVPDCDLTEERPLRLACGQVEATFLPTLRRVLN